VPQNNQAAEASLRRQHEQDKIVRYIRAYQQNPETKEEIEAVRAAAGTILSEESW